MKLNFTNPTVRHHEEPTISSSSAPQNWTGFAHLALLMQLSLSAETHIHTPNILKSLSEIQALKLDFLGK